MVKNLDIWKIIKSLGIQIACLFVVVDSTDPTSNGISDQVLIQDSLATDGV